MGSRLLSAHEPTGRRLFAFLSIGGELGCRHGDLRRALHIASEDALNRQIDRLGFPTERLRDDAHGRVHRVRLADPELWRTPPAGALP